MNYLLDQHYLDAIAQGRFTFAYGVSLWLALLIVAGLVGVDALSNVDPQAVA